MAKLGEMLIKEGLLTEEQLQESLALQKKKHEFLGSILIRKGYVKERVLVDVLARQTGSPVIDLTNVLIDKQLAKLIPWETAWRHNCVPVKETGGLLHVATLDPSNTDAMNEVGAKSKKTVKTFLTGPTGLARAWDQIYGDQHTRDGKILARSIDGMKNSIDQKTQSDMSLVSKDYSTLGQPTTEEEETVETLEVDQFDEIVSGVLEDVNIIDIKEESQSQIGLSIAAESAPIIKMVNGILLKAIDMGASDVHIEPFEKVFRVRFRIDGILHGVMNLPSRVKNSVISRLKIMASMDIAERRIPQDGRIKLKVGKKEVDLRVSTVPTTFGEKVVMRLLGQGNLQDGVGKLGFEPMALKEVEMAIHNPWGMILVTGPTGSGKSTTLYTALKQLNTADVNITTAEDPVEYNLPGITQVGIHAAIGFTFESALRAFLRQDPDIIMVGEIRDKETAEIAIKAALTGHLVLSTLHTNDAPSTLTRLVDMGIDPFLCSAAVRLIIAQRLVRRLCPKCKIQNDLAAEELEFLETMALPKETIDSLKPFKPKGCPECNSIGYKGRAPVFEVMAIKTRKMKDMLIRGASLVEISDQAKKEGMRTLKDMALSLVTQGVTSLDEALGITIAE